MTSHIPGPSTGPAEGSAVPKVGGVRCYWALLKPRYPVPEIPGSKLELVFIHPDPVLNAHLQKQSMSLTGRGVIEFIHPSEREQARHDLLNAISTDDLQGSVTRVRFARLSRLRLILGCRPDEIEYFENHEKVVEDDEWMVIDLVLNWVADGLLLAFFHAIKDLDPVANNDPNRISEGWSNFCGTANMTDDQLESLYHDVSSAVSPPPATQLPPTRIFQLHTTPFAPSRPAELIFTWPPGRPPGADPRVADGLYEPGEYADLMKQVDMDPSQLRRAPDEVRTTCTTRFGATHSVSSEGCYRMIQSVYIPYGSLIFCCFQTTRTFNLSPRSSEAYGMLPGPPPPEWMAGPPGQGPNGSGMPMPPPGAMPMPMGAGGPGMPRAGHPGGPGHGPPGLPGLPHMGDWRGPGGDYVPPMSGPPPPGQAQPGQGYYDDRYPPGPPPGHPGHPEMGYNAAAGNYDAQGPGAGSHSSPTGMHANTSPANSSRPLVRPPGNVDCCQMCGIRESPEWRRSESGIKDLCNACGLRLARQVAKREGRQKPRKKKEKSE